jgi:hypothetical protein
MKKMFPIWLLISGMITGTLLAQSTQVNKREMGDKEKMQLFRAWEGRWQGEGTIQMGPGEPKKSKVEEHIEFKLDSMIVIVEGIGKALDPVTKTEQVVHHAFAVLSYDKNTSQYKFRSFLKDGQSTEAWFNVAGENKYAWGFETPNGKIRYNIIIDPTKKAWNETGEFSRDGTNWMKFFEMNLTKVE